MNVNRPIYLPGLRSEDGKGSLCEHLSPPPLGHPILYKRKGNLSASIF